MSRLIVLAGLGGAGTSTLARATAEQLRDEGVSVTLVDGSGESPASSAASDVVAAALGPVVATLGADPLAREAWMALPGLSALSALLECSVALEEHDAVLLDAGTVARARELIGLPGVLHRLLDAALTPILAMARDAEGQGAAFTSLSDARMRVLALGRLLQRPSTTARLVMPPSMEAVPRMTAAIGEVACLGVAVEGVVVNRYPRASAGWPESVTQEARQALAAMTAAADGLPVWKSTSRLRPVPKGRSALGPLGPVAVLDAGRHVVEVDDENLWLDLALPAQAREDARVGVLGEQLVVGLPGAVRWLDLPPVLTRCEALSAQRTATGIRVRFRPDPAKWPASREEGDAA